MKHPSDFAIDQEEAALDKIHAALAAGPKCGLMARQIAHDAGLSIGRVREILAKSECILRRVRGSMRWIADWTELPEEYRPHRVMTAGAKVAARSHKPGHPGSTPGPATNHSPTVGRRIQGARSGEGRPVSPASPKSHVAGEPSDPRLIP